MDKKKFIKIVEPAYQNYSGELGIVIFKNGVSVEKWPWHIQQRISAAMRVVTIEDDGAELAAGPAEEMLRQARTAAAVIKPMREFSEKDKLKEMLKSAAVTVPPSQFYTREELEDIAGKSKRAGLTAIAKLWKIRATSIPDLIENILAAQQKFEDSNASREHIVYRRYERVTPGASAEEVMKSADGQTELFDKPKAEVKAEVKEEPAVETKKVPEDEVGSDKASNKAVIEAALTGDMTAVINAGE